ncbi:hypothetical protein NC653_028678 [Populus alba x Populus x berolinensis]|uniref:Uncharacterized protein n=1 Tax=Populus alba x Populus x berolinensis TaxID=444605 RepID=A0AAD6Q4D5_9ROSI|nr:hypothetical protein NC653_028678 [Populus alba x Populus x berolinensis]
MHQESIVFKVIDEMEIGINGARDSYRYGDDFDDDVEDLPSLPSDIFLFFMDSTCGWLFPSLEALDENLSFCTSDSAHRASNELNIDIIVIETWIKEMGCVYFLFLYVTTTTQAIKDRLLWLKTGLFLRFQEKGFPLRFLEGEGFLAWIRYMREGGRRGVEVGPKDDLVQLLLVNWTKIYFNCPLEVEHPLFDLSPPWKAEMKVDCLSKFQHGTWGAFGTCQN